MFGEKTLFGVTFGYNNSILSTSEISFWSVLTSLLRAVLYNKESLKITKGGNQNPYIEEQTTQWTKEKGPYEKDKQ